jgi:PAS domain S-box-containing protein
MSSTRFNRRPSGIESAGMLPWGSDFCVFYASTRELLEVLVPFMRAGLEHNEFCLWEVRAPLTVEDAARALSEAVTDFARYVGRQVEIVPRIESPDGDLRREIERRLDRAILAGFDGLRLVHGAGGARGAEVSDGRLVRRLNVIAAVPYAREELDALDFMQAVQRHPFALVCNAGRWDLLHGSEVHTAREALQRSEERLRWLFQNMSEGFAYHRIVLDGQGKPCDYVFLEVNPAFERLTGLDAEAICGKRVTHVLPGIESDPADWIGRYGRVALTGESLRFESYAAPLDRWFAVSAFSPGTGYFACTFADITERRRAEAERAVAQEALQRAMERLEEDDRRKDQFLATMSHELRNPLAPIRYAVQLVQAGPLGESGSRAVAVIDRQVDRLTRLVDDLLDISRITADRIELRRETVTLASIISAATESASPAAAAASHTLKTSVPDEPIWLHADPLRLTQVVANLLDNSSKYTPSGGRITLEGARENGNAVIRVRDTGIGLSADALPHVFEMFWQAGRPDKAQPGMGIGLALARQLIELHGGTIEAHSAGAGQGAEFVVRLPAAEAPKESGIGAPAQTKAARPLRVLVVDDNVDLVEMLVEIIRSLGHDVRAAHDGPTAVAEAIAHRPHVAFLDLGLPTMGGVEVARELRRRPETAAAQLVALTGWGRDEDRQATTEAMFDHHLTKPADLDALRRLLADVAARKTLP